MNVEDFHSDFDNLNNDSKRHVMGLVKLLKEGDATLNKACIKIGELSLKNKGE